MPALMHVLTNNTETTQEKEKAIYKDLLAGLSTKQVANKHGVEISQVMQIKKQFMLGTMRGLSTVNINNLSAKVEKGYSANVIDMKPKTKEIEINKIVEEKKSSSDAVDIQPKINEPVKRKKSKSRIISEDTVSKIIKDAESGKYSTAEIAKRNNVSVCTVYNKLEKHGVKNKYISKNKEKTKNKLADNKVTTNTNEKNNSLLNKFDVDDDVIFINIIDSQFLPSKNDCIFACYHTRDHKKYDQVCLDFISKQIPFINGTATKRIVAYSSGIVAAAISLVRACAIMKVNLTIKHPDRHDHSNFISQIVFSDFEMAGTEYDKLKDLASTNGETLIYNATKFDIIKSDKFYVFHESIVKATSEEIENVILIKDAKDIWELYPKKVEEILKDEERRITITVNEYHNNSGKLTLVRSILQAKN